MNPLHEQTGQPPAHLRPQAVCLVPPRKRVKAQHAPSQERMEPPIRIPDGVHRVVVLSNVTVDFPWHSFRLQAGDLVIHCNRARHRTEAMEADGTRHWLFVRHGKGNGEKGWNWYHPTRFQGFQKVFFIDDATLLAPFQWMKEFRQRSKKSPTTGFIVANIMRETAPEIPLVLLGFDPGAKHGTYRWPGHDWMLESAWYEQKQFRLIKPSKPAKLMLLVCSCTKNKELRQACRDTWLSALPPGVEYRFFIGAAAPLVDEPDVICLPGVADTYIRLPEKVMAAIGHAYEQEPWDFLGKVDDDTYLRVDRLLPLLEPGVHLLGRSRGGRRCPGGAGYFMSREAAGKLLAHKEKIPPEGDEDGLITKKLVALGYTITDCKQLKQTRNEGFPEDGNDIISGHQLKRPELHYACHQKNTGT